MADSLGFADLPQMELQQATAMEPAFGALLGMRDANLVQLSYMPPIANPADRGELARLALDPQGLERASTLALGFGPGIIKSWHGTPHTFPPAVEESGIDVFHGTLHGDIGSAFLPGAHFGTQQAANSRLNELLANPDIYEMNYPPSGEATPAIYPVKINPKKMLDMEDPGDWNDSEIYDQLHKKGMLSDKEYSDIQKGILHGGERPDALDFLRSKGYDAVRYKNNWEDTGNFSYMTLDPSIVKLMPEQRVNPLGAFRDEAIGSGEGAQAYGYGHYVAGNPKVAEGYQKNLSNRASLSNFYDTPQTQAALAVQSVGLDKAIANFKNNMTNFAVGHPAYEKSLAALQAIEDESYKNVELPSGHLLEVHILPEEHELLDWDKPLSEQPEIANKLRNVVNASPLGAIEGPGRSASGELMYRDLQSALGAPGASAALHEAGIPGIKYLDAGSRQAGEGTHNYVIFHPSNLRIVGRDGQRLTPVEGDPFAGDTP